MSPGAALALWAAALAALARPDPAAPRATPLVLVVADGTPDSAWVASLLARGVIAGTCRRSDPRICTTERVGAVVVRLLPPERVGDSTRVRLDTHAYAECGGATRHRAATLVETPGGPRVVRLELLDDAAACGPPRQE